MEPEAFDRLAGSFSTRAKRRVVAAGLGGGVLSLIGFHTDLDVNAGKKKKKKKKKKKNGTSPPPSGCTSGLVPCTPGSASCCTPASVVSACKSGIINSACPGCFPGKSNFCDFCLNMAAIEWFYCCDLYAITYGPAGVNTCICNECDCCSGRVGAEKNISDWDSLSIPAVPIQAES